VPRTIWKYPFIGEDLHVMLPDDVRVVLVADDHNGTGLPTIWIEQDHAQPTGVLSKLFRVFGTGHPIPPRWAHVGSAQMNTLVWHVYKKED
jgi:hypothetical protein